jgi:hypothetical protein
LLALEAGSTTRKPNREGRVATLLDSDVAAHHLAEPLADREAEAGAAVFSRGGGISLRKFLEQPPHLFFSHIDADIGHGNRDPIAAIEPLSMQSRAMCELVHTYPHND